MSKDLFMVYHTSPDKNKSMYDMAFHATLQSFQRYNSSATIEVWTDMERTHYRNERFDWNIIQRSPSPILARNRLFTMAETRTCYDRIIVGDSDCIYLRDPFADTDMWDRIVDKKVGVCSRIWPNNHPIACGFHVFLPVEKNIWFGRKMDEYIAQIGDTTTPDMDYWSELYRNDSVSDIGWYWNFCPGTEMGHIRPDIAIEMLRRAIATRSVGMVHIKGQYKMLLYEVNCEG
jgi:hypothetical protein